MQQQRDIQELFRELLLYHDLTETLSCFETETLRKPWKEVKPTNAKHTLSKTKVKERFLLSIDEGNHTLFNELWLNYILEKKQQDQNGLKLEFYANIYFAVFPIHPASQGLKIESLAASKNRFKMYLESRGDALAKYTEFLPYYALPFVPNPIDHPTFKDIFTMQWVQDLKEQIIEFAEDFVESTATPSIYSIYKVGLQTQLANDERLPAVKTRSRGNSREGDSQLKLAACEHREMKLREMLLVNQEVIQQLRLIAVGLLSALDETRIGKTVTTDYLQDMAARLAKLGGAPINLQSTVGKSVSSAVRLSNSKSRRNRAPSREMLASSIFAPLDFFKIKEHLSRGEPLSKAYLIQALRWRIVKSAAGESRKRVIQSYINADLFSFTQTSKDLLSAMLQERFAGLREELLRFLNVLASDSTGRSYLGKGPIVSELLRVLQSEIDDTISKQNCIGALQKLSLSHQLQTDMIRMDAINFVLESLRKAERMSEYSLEYSSALLMNLCLRRSGRVKCEELDVLDVLSRMLDNKDTQIREYIHGCLYSLFKRPSMRGKARSMGFEALIKTAANTSSPQIRKQLDYVLRQLKSDELDDAESDDENEDEPSEEDDEAEDFDENYESLPNQGNAQGEKLLCGRFLLANENAIIQTEEVSASMALQGKTKISESSRNEDLQRRDSLAHAASESSTNPIVRDDEAPLLIAIEGASASNPIGQVSSKLLPSSIRLQSDLKRGVKIDNTKPEEIHEYEQAFGTRPRLARTPIRPDRVLHGHTSVDLDEAAYIPSAQTISTEPIVLTSYNPPAEPPRKQKGKSNLKPPSHRKVGVPDKDDAVRSRK